MAVLGSLLAVHSSTPSSTLFTLDSAPKLRLNESPTFKAIRDFAYTLWLFTFSDLKTVFFPTLIFGTAAAPISSISQILPRAAWIWLHLLQFCLSNQCLSPEEDAVNKPWRPIAAGRITTENARILRWAMLPVCLFVSARYGVLLPSITLAMATLAHNELRLDSGWLARNVCNAVGYASFNAGATYAACAGGCDWEATSVAAQVLNALVILTTIQAQDFQDIEGDQLSGRWTLPIAFPRSSRWAMPVLLTAWSFFLAAYWQASPIHTAILVLLGAIPGLRFALGGSASADRTSYRLYNLWLCAVHVTPFVAA